MAYYNANGQITIDEAVALADVRKINAAKEHLAQSRQALQTLISTASGMQGQTGSAIAQKAEEMLTQVNRLIQNLEESAGLINRTVARYQRIDAELAQQIRR